MKSEAEFKHFFYQELLPQIGTLEKRRKELLKRRIKVIGGGVMYLLVHFFLAHSGSLPEFTFVFALLFVPALCFYLYNRYFDDTTLDTAFKNEILVKIIAFFDDSLTYQPEAYLPYQDFDESGFFRLKPEIYTGDDMISGAIDGINIRFSEVKASYRVMHLPKDQTKPRYQNIFWGVLLVAEYPTPFEGELMICADELQKNLGYVGRLVQENNSKQGIYLYARQTDFSRYFACYTPDEAKGEKLLTPLLQQRLIGIRKRYNAQVSVALRNQTIWVAVNMNREFFSIKKSRYWSDYQYIRTFYNDLAFILGIIDDLNIDELDLPTADSTHDKFGRERLITSQKIRSWLDRFFDWLVEKVPRLQQEKQKLP